jgi:chaperone protein EcpD
MENIMINSNSCIKNFIYIALLLSMSSKSFAAVVIGSTRVIYPENEREVTVKLSNEGKNAVLVQSWIDDGNVSSKPEEISVPFILTPPINRIDANKSQTLRLTYTGEVLQKDRESVFWLNILEIPRSNTSIEYRNGLQVAFRSRIKLFYRPTNLSGNALDAPTALNWSRLGKKITAYNDSPYFISLVTIAINNGLREETIDGEMIPPYDSREFMFKHILSSGANHQLQYDYVNDWGAVKKKIIKI